MSISEESEMWQEIVKWGVKSIPDFFSSRKLEYLILQSNLSQAKMQTTKSQMQNLMILPAFRQQSKNQCIRF